MPFKTPIKSDIGEIQLAYIVLGIRDSLIYNMEVVMLLAFRLNSHQARAVRRELTERISRDHKPFEVVMTAVKGGKK